MATPNPLARPFRNSPERDGERERISEDQAVRQESLIPVRLLGFEVRSEPDPE